jgi:hypothetical protein
VAKKTKPLRLLTLLRLLLLLLMLLLRLLTLLLPRLLTLLLPSNLASSKKPAFGPVFFRLSFAYFFSVFLHTTKTTRKRHTNATPPDGSR